MLKKYQRYSVLLKINRLRFGQLGIILGEIQNFIRLKYLGVLVDLLVRRLRFLTGGEIFVGWPLRFL